MKIAMVGQKGIPASFGGIERHVEALATRLGAAGHEVVVYTRAWYAAPAARFSKGVRTIVTPTIRTKHLDAIVHAFTSTVHAIVHGADIIHYHGVGPSLLSWIPRVFAPRTKIVATFHCIDRKQRVKWGVFARFFLGLGERTACIFPHETITVSRTLQAYCKDRYNRDAHYIPNGVTPPSRRIGTEVLTKFGIAPNGYILLVARLIPSKGVHFLIDAFQTLQERGMTKGLKLVIVGDSAFTDDYVKRLRAMAAGNTDILFTGYLKGRALEQVFNGAYVVAHPSEAEGLPIAVLEAMSYGKTVIASDIPENMEVTRNRAIHFRNRSTPDLTKKLRYAIENPVFVREIGESAKSFVLDEYRWDDVAKGVAEVYRQLVPVQARLQARTAALTGPQHFARTRKN